MHEPLEDPEQEVREDPEDQPAALQASKAVLQGGKRVARDRLVSVRSE
jgi:hypothetical protein